MADRPAAPRRYPSAASACRTGHYEAAPWLALATSLQQEAEFELADRAYANAFAAEATNAQILWSRAQNLQQMGKLVEARALYRQLADGTWQPRFQGLQQQARWYLT